jgi:hypothetical protein
MLFNEYRIFFFISKNKNSNGIKIKKSLNTKRENDYDELEFEVLNKSLLLITLW